MKYFFTLTLLGSFLYGESNIKNLILIESNSISQGSYIDDSSLKQGVLSVEKSIISDSEFKFTNDIYNVDIAEKSTVQQSTLSLNGSTIKNSKLNLNNTISNSTIGRTTIDQSVIVLNSSEIKDSNITATNIINKLKTGGINDISQSYMLMNSNSHISKSSLVFHNTIDDTYISDSSISQADLIMNSGSISNATISNTNKIFNDSQVLRGSSLIQGRIELSNGATLSHDITISSTSNNVTLKNSNITMCGVNISSDSTANISKTCSDIGSKYTNVNVNIAGS